MKSILDIILMVLSIICGLSSIGLFIYTFIVIDKKIKGVSEKKCECLTKADHDLLMERIDRFDKKSNFLFSRMKFNKERLDETLKRLDKLDKDYEDFGGFINQIVCEMKPKKVKQS